MPELPGTAPSPLEPLPWRDDADGSEVEVVVRMLGGEMLHGQLRHEDQLESHGSLLPIRVRSSELMISLRDVRAIELQSLMTLSHRTHALDKASTAGPARDATELVRFHLHFVDGVEWNGTTLGHRTRSRGLQLYVRLPSGSFKPVWVPRSALHSARFQPLAELGQPAPAGRPRQDTNIVAHVEGGLNGSPARNIMELARVLESCRKLPFISMEQAILELRVLNRAQIDTLRRESPDALHGHGEELIHRGLLSGEQIDHVHARMACIPEISALDFEIEPKALDRLPLKVASSHEVLPLGWLDGTLVVASPHPMNQEVERQIRVLTNCSVILVWAGKSQILQRLFREMHPNEVPILDSHALPVGGGNDIHALLDASMTELRVQGAEDRDIVIDESSSLVRLVTKMIMDAYAQKASDIHIETNPGAEFLRVRFRKDGELEDYLRMPAFLRASLISRIKVMSRLDISEKRRPQDGKINFHDYSPLPLELRVAILPTHDGLEDVVMRLLASSKPMPLMRLGLSQRDDALIKKMSERSFGLLLACGPTGSGKTTTLHSILAHINTDNRKIWTAEDPIEITQPGLRQLHVNPKIGVTFASAMRAFLRADPDVIMIGEIRDEETAGVAIEASLTGHLVLSTLHTNSAAESIVRLLDMGMDPMNFADSLVGIVAQRLVRGLCASCAQPRKLDAAQIEALMLEYIEGSETGRDAGWARLLAAGGVSNPDQLRVLEPVGCEHCRGTGYKGRMGIYEILENGPGIKRLIQNRAGTSDILSEAFRQGMRSLRQDALEKVVQGRIDLKQARAAYL
jgi:type II secretory ATPase GspE/PulE/Tfp pilus assembly ATPase PilB-like protein